MERINRQDDAPKGHNNSSIPDLRRWWVLAVVGTAQLMVVLDATIVNIALPSAQNALAFSAADRQWVVTAYALAFGSLLLVGGRISDTFGCKRMFMIGLIGFAIASAAGGAATGFFVLVLARTVQGAFAALLAPTALSLLSATFPTGQERAKAFGIFAAVAGGGGAVGLLLGGIMTQFLSWRWCLYVNVVFAVVAVVGVCIFVRKPPRVISQRLDLPGSAVSVCGLVALVYGFSEASKDGWTGPRTLGLLTTGAALLVVFLSIERRRPHPLIPLTIFADRTRAAAYMGSRCWVPESSACS